MNVSLFRLPIPRPAIASALAVLALLGALAGASPASADAMSDGEDALESGRYDDAVAAYRTATTELPNDAEAWLGLGLALEKKRQWQAAHDAFAKASALDARRAEPWRGQGSMLLRLEKPAEAEAAFRKAVEIDRKFPAAQLGLGQSLVRQKKIPEAIAVYEAGVKFGSKTAPDFYKGLGEAEAARDSVRAAEVWLIKARESATSMSPSVQGPIFRALGDLYMQRKIPSLAIQNYQQAKAIDESDLDTRMALGDAYERGTLYNDALEEYKAVVAADPQYAEGYLKLGDLYYRASASDPQRVFQSIETLEKLLELEPNNLKGKALLAQAHFRKGGVEGKARAKQLLDEIAATGQFPPEAYRVLGIIQYETGEFQNALASFAKAPRLEPIDLRRQADIYRRLAADAPDAEKDALYGRADSVYLSIIERDTASADAKQASFERARLRYLMKDYPGAVERLDAAIKLDPNSGEAYYYRGLSKRAMGDDAAGLEDIRKAIELDPKQGGWYIQLGAAYSKLKQVDAAKDAFRRAADLDTTTTVGAVARQQLGYYSLLEKDYSPAIRWLEESSTIDEKQVQTWVWLGQAHQNAGNKAEACKAYRKVLQLRPGEPNATKGIAQLGC